MTTALLTVTEASARLGRSSDFVRGLCHGGHVHSLQIRGRYYIPADALEAFVQSPTTQESQVSRRALPPRVWKGQRRK